MTREESLCNPLGIKHEPGMIWLGQANDQPDKVFVKYESPQYGVRAGVRTLLSYQRRDGVQTVAGAIRRWSPPTENDTQAYLDDVCTRARCTPETPLNPRSIPLLRAMIVHENGPDALAIYTDAVIQQGIDLA
jgi:hypothetical protein